MKWVLIDFSFLSYRALHSTGDLSFEDVPTGVIYGFWEQLLEICSNPSVQSNKIALFGDSKKSYRRNAFPQYKMKRYAQRTEEQKQKIQTMHDQMNILRRKVFPKVGIPFYQQTGLESDDLIAWVAKKLTKKKEQAIIITSDGDLYQCITDFVTWFDPQRNKHMTPTDLMRDKGVHPNQWAKVKAIGGCSSDCVPGIVGVSEKGAIDYLLGNIPKHYKRYKCIASKEGQRTIRSTIPLVALPHEKTKAMRLFEPSYNASAFFDHAIEFGIDSYLERKKKKRWIRFFEGVIKRSSMPRMRNKKNGEGEAVKKTSRKTKAQKKIKQRHTIRKRNM